MDSVSTEIMGSVTYNLNPVKLIQQIKQQYTHQSNHLKTEVQCHQKIQFNLDDQQQLLRTVIDASPNIIFVKNWQGEYILANQALAKFYDTTVDQIIGKTDADFNPHQHQTELFLQIDRQVITTQTPKRIEAEPWRRLDGEIRWFQTTKIPILSSDGRTYHLLGVATDITKRHEAERILWLQVEREHLLRNISQQIYRRFTLQKIFAETVTQLQQILMSDRILLYRPQDEHRYQVVAEQVSRQWPSLQQEPIQDPWLTQKLQEMVSQPIIYPYVIENIEKQSFSQETQNWLAHQQVKSLLILPILCQEEMLEVCCSSEFSGYDSPTCHSCRSQQLNRVWGFLVAHQCRNHRRWLPEEIELLRSLATPIALAIGQGELREQLETANRKLQQLAHYDSLTGLANRYQFDQYLQQEWSRMRRESQPLSLILLDVDFFKGYNDTYGHPQGDQCLQAIAEILQKSVRRSTDLVARYGGEEFAVILPNTPLKGAKVVAQAIQRNLKKRHLQHEASPISSSVTLSLGVSTWIPDQNTEFDRLVQSADQALYQAKKLGRDRFVLFDQKSGSQAPSPRLHWGAGFQDG